MRRLPLLLLALAVTSAPVSAVRALEECRRQLRLAGPSEAAAECYFEVAWENRELRSTAKAEMEDVIHRSDAGCRARYPRLRKVIAELEAPELFVAPAPVAKPWNR